MRASVCELADVATPGAIALAVVHLGRGTRQRRLRTLSIAPLIAACPSASADDTSVVFAEVMTRSRRERGRFFLLDAARSDRLVGVGGVDVGSGSGSPNKHDRRPLPPSFSTTPHSISIHRLVTPHTTSHSQQTQRHVPERKGREPPVHPAEELAPLANSSRPRCRSYRRSRTSRMRCARDVLCGSSREMERGGLGRRRQVQIAMCSSWASLLL